MKRVFITGVSGLLGTNLVHYLLERNYEVIGLVRNKLSYKGKLHSNLELREGSLFDDFSPLFREIDYIIHIAAITAQDIPKYKQYRTINSEATKQLFLMAKVAKVKGFVFVSSANTMGNGSLLSPGNESKPVSKPFADSFYAKSKLEAENYLIANQKGIHLCIINPCFMLGAYDSKPSSGKIILRALNKSFIFHPPGGKSFVHVADVCQAIWKGLQTETSGQKFLIGNENLSYKEFYTKFNQLTGHKSKLIEIPKWILLSAGYLGNFLRFMGISTPLSSTNMKMLFSDNYYSNQKSIEELGVKYQPIESGMTEAIEYLKKEFNKG